MKLENILEYANIHNIQMRLDFQSYSEDQAQSTKSGNVVAKLIDCINTAAKSPEEIMIEEENAGDKVELYRKIKATLTERQYSVFALLYAKGLTKSQTANTLGISHTRVDEINKAIIRKIQEFPCSTFECLRRKQSTLEADSPQIKIRYPSDYLQHVYVSGYKGKRRWICRTVCKIPEYLDEAFHDKASVCNCCSKCRSKYMKERTA